jgi:hypothetical protein
MSARGEPYYVLCPPDMVVRVVGSERERLLHRKAPTRWTQPGAGRNAAAAAMLRDATGIEPDPRVAIAFSHDILDYHFADRQVLITAGEVRAWYGEREPEVMRATRDAPTPTTLPEMLAQADAALRGGPWASWLTTFRTVHGTPELDSALDCHGDDPFEIDL